MNRATIADMLVRVNAFEPFRFLNRGKLLVLMYHRFSEGEEIGRTSRRTLEAHLSYLTRHYKIISLTEAAACIRDGNKFPERSAVITVDDGYRDFYEIAFPVLERFGTCATLYLVTEFVAGNCWIWTDKARYIVAQTLCDELSFETNGKKFDRILSDAGTRLMTAGSLNSELKKLTDDEKELCLADLATRLKVTLPELPSERYAPLNWDQVRRMAEKGVEIGSHTLKHPILTNVDAARLESELVGSKAAIQSELGLDTVHFCYPNGDVSQRERDAAEAAGYASAVSTEIRLCETGDDPFLIPRIDAEPEMRRFVQATSGFDRLK